MTGPLKVDTAALEAVARELGGWSDELSDGVVHEWQPPVAQPTGQATVDVTGAANHVMSEASANLLLFADDVASAARVYAATDSQEARHVGATMQPPK